MGFGWVIIIFDQTIPFTRRVWDELMKNKHQTTSKQRTDEQMNQSTGSEAGVSIQSIDGWTCLLWITVNKSSLKNAIGSLSCIELSALFKQKLMRFAVCVTVAKNKMQTQAGKRHEMHQTRQTTHTHTHGGLTAAAICVWHTDSHCVSTHMHTSLPLSQGLFPRADV